jgi:hypothetical protein
VRASEDFAWDLYFFFSPRVNGNASDDKCYAGVPYEAGRFIIISVPASSAGFLKKEKKNNNRMLRSFEVWQDFLSHYI